MRKRIQLVVAIHRDGSYVNGWFRVVSRHIKRRAANRKAVSARKAGYLARVRNCRGRWVVAVRRPRIKAPGINHLAA